METEENVSFDKNAYQRDYNKSVTGKQSRKKYRHDNSKYLTDAKYLSRQIVAIDGEGINIRSGADKGQHLYVLLAISGKPPLIDKRGIRTEDALRYLFDNLRSEDINVIYGGSYDFNCWLHHGLNHDEAKYVYRGSYGTTPLQHHGYGIRWIKGKTFEISRGDKTIVVNDVISFFQRPFIAACDEYLGSYQGRDVLVREKARRGDFRMEELDGIGSYNQLELDLLVRLVNELRNRLNRVGLRPRRWNSPGAIAAALFRRERVSEHRNENIPKPVATAARFAYAGGRFEMIKYGSVKGRVFEYDINSAYPCALLEVPSLRDGEWIRHTGEDARKHYRFALYRVQYSGSDPTIPGPIFVRAPNGTISYPLTAENWVWTPEYETLMEYCDVVADTRYNVVECWEYKETSNYRPFSFIRKLYDKRRELKRLKDGAHVGIKLALNSIYGKLAQQVGWKAATDRFPLRVPTYHQLEWAGFVTSWCRANVLRAALTDIHSVIAFETDALFTTRALKVNVGTDLGEWEKSSFRSLTYVQSGHYYGTLTDGSPVVKCRGIDRGFIKRARIEKLLLNPEHSRILKAQLTRFYGLGIALARGLDAYWCRWITEPKNIQLHPTGKRVHGACDCDRTGPLTIGIWHNTFCPVEGGVSAEFPVEWINPNPEMTELSEFRESENYYGE